MPECWRSAARRTGPTRHETRWHCKDELTGQVTVVGLDRAAHNVLREQPRAHIKAIDHWINAELPAPRSKTDRFCNAIGQPPV
jgi:hypothetical protein